MTKDLKDILDKEITDALDSNDEGRIFRCTARYIQAIGDCQYKTSDRVKNIKTMCENTQIDVKQLRDEITPMKESHEQFQSIITEKNIIKKWFKYVKWAIIAVVGIVGWEGVHQIIDILQKVSM